MRAVILASHPHGPVSAAHFEVRDVPTLEAQEGQILVRNMFLSLDPGVRVLLGAQEGYIAPILVGDPLVTLAMGEVTESRHLGFQVGDLIVGRGLTAESSVITPDVDPMCWKLDQATMTAPSNSLGIQGAAGMTAYFGLLDVAKPQPGETVLVSGAAGAVGSAAGQIAKIHGCRAVGIAGGPVKAKRLTKEFGFDAAIDYQGLSLAELTAAVKAVCPDGVDVFFDNVGGTQLDAALDCMNWKGRVTTCGMISQYNTQVPPAMHNLFQVVANALRIEGFLVHTYADQFDGAIAALGEWVRDGRLVFREDIVEGLDSFGGGFARLFDGSAQGKMLVKL
ncbi:NADP-dependent oxidoreductase [Aeromicrobium sp.]|uniref:NADP-dependent oxidoreductase n=1 Tax=Aeromicrobium sp. TaxID=1871063 RepID=UPI00199EDC77|nr:NADP-dependent oxidoreductase [Aeromicrobium sp.]MBC7633854.1 NADP-dependent oxidoreductase [Aeromicrobium sp.]